MVSSSLISQIATKKSDLVSSKSSQLTEKTLDVQGLRRVKEEAFIKIAAKVQRYIDLSLVLRENHPEFEGLPPTELETNEDGELVPTRPKKTEAIDQQRQLYAAARSALIDPAYGDQIMGDLVEWHDTFVSHYVIDQNGPTVRARFYFEPGATRGDPPDPKANLRLTYALQGSATLVEALRAAAGRCGNAQQAHLYRGKADEIASLSLAIADRFYEDYADNKRPGRYFLYPWGNHEISGLVGLSHNNSQSYLIEGMAALAGLNHGRWQPRLLDLLTFIQTQRDRGSGLLREFDFAAAGTDFPVDEVSKTEFKWQVNEGHETVILGHTLAGLFAWPAKIIADDLSKWEQMPALIDAFIELVNRIAGIKTNGLPANGFELIPLGIPPFKPMMDWPEGAWQAEILWQFLLHADRAGISLNSYEVKADATTLTLDRLFARGLALHDKKLFNGVSYFAENKAPLVPGRAQAAPINHAADTLRDLASNLL
jgi:hypothetical protein